MVGLITQAIENRPFSRIKRLAKKVIEEDNGLIRGKNITPGRLA
jgi:tRNA 2-selenouridine synthase SelU